MVFIIERKEDVWAVPEGTDSVEAKCALSLHAAQRIVEVHKIKSITISGDAWAVMKEDAREFMQKNAHIRVEGKIEHHGFGDGAARKIREEHVANREGLLFIAKKYKTTVDKVWHVIHGRKR